MATTTNKPIASHTVSVTNKPVVAEDEEPQEEAKAVNKPARAASVDDTDDVARGDADSIANWTNRKGAPIFTPYVETDDA